jgi:hypothetical protein
MSDLVARNAHVLDLQCDARGRALLIYRERNGRVVRLLLSGAINARPSSSPLPQTRFLKRYRGPSRIRDVSHSYSGPPLTMLVAARTLPDGSHWAVQAWRRMLPNYGFPPRNSLQAAVELHVSHWLGPLPVLEGYPCWAASWGSDAHRLIGRLTYRGLPVHGRRSTAGGNPLELFGRNVRIDVRASPLNRRGWARENAILTHRPTGVFCYVLVPRRVRWAGKWRWSPAAVGDMYRLRVMGPGVTPVVETWIRDPGDWDPNDSEKARKQERAKELLLRWEDRLCRPL